MRHELKPQQGGARFSLPGNWLTARMLRNMPKSEVLSRSEFARATELALSRNITREDMTDRAGQAIVDTIAKIAPADARVVILCGPGGNGADGFAAARHAKARGFDVVVLSVAEPKLWKPATAAMAKQWNGRIEHDDWAAEFDKALDGGKPSILVDALLGSGLDRAPVADFAAAIELLRQSHEMGFAVVAVDVPSGLDADGKATRTNFCVHATHAIAYLRRRLAHVLLPGRTYCGDIIIADVGIPESVFGDLDGDFADDQNFEPIFARMKTVDTDKWAFRLAVERLEADKSRYGRLAIVEPHHDRSSSVILSAEAAARCGAAAITLAVQRSSIAQMATGRFSGELWSLDDRPVQSLAGQLHDTDTLFLHSADHGTKVLTSVLETSAALVLEGQTALACLKLAPEAMKSRAMSRRPSGVIIGEASGIITQAIVDVGYHSYPSTLLILNESEFSEAFGASKDIWPERLHRAAEASRCSIILKSAVALAASPDESVIAAAHVSRRNVYPGSGDVLRGFVAGFLTSDMPPIDAISAAIWLHGACAETLGHGFVATNVLETISPAVNALKTNQLGHLPSSRPRLEYAT